MKSVHGSGQSNDRTMTRKAENSIDRERHNAVRTKLSSLQLRPKIRNLPQPGNCAFAHEPVGARFARRCRAAWIAQALASWPRRVMAPTVRSAFDALVRRESATA
jgi:hypothetical protein